MEQHSTPCAHCDGVGVIPVQGGHRTLDGVWLPSRDPQDEVEIPCPNCEGSGHGPTQLMRSFLGATITDKRSGAQHQVVSVSDGGLLTLDNGDEIGLKQFVRHYRGQYRDLPVRVAYWRQNGYHDPRLWAWGYRLAHDGPVVLDVVGRRQEVAV